MDKWIGKWAFPLDDSLLEQSARRGELYDFEKMATDIISKVEFKRNDVVLDVCCGNAALTRFIAKTCEKIHGVDFSIQLIDSAKRIKEKENVFNLYLHLSDALNIDKLFTENMFDKSYCYFSFQYFNKKKRKLLLNKLSWVTKPNGLIFIGDIPDETRKWNFYKTKMKFYREKISRLIQFKDGECNLGWWIAPREIISWCNEKKLKAKILGQENLPHAHYRFDVLIQNTK